MAEDYKTLKPGIEHNSQLYAPLRIHLSCITAYKHPNIPSIANHNMINIYKANNIVDLIQSVDLFCSPNQIDILNYSLNKKCIQISDFNI